MLSAIRSFFKGYANFSGRSTRPEFWWVWLLNMIIFLPAYYSLFTGVESDKAIRNTDSTSLTRCGYPLGLYFYCICSFGCNNTARYARYAKSTIWRKSDRE